jgi:hypothetical protein
MGLFLRPRASLIWQVAGQTINVGIDPPTATLMQKDVTKTIREGVDLICQDMMKGIGRGDNLPSILQHSPRGQNEGIICMDPD